jgi:hypothetical protein
MYGKAMAVKMLDHRMRQFNVVFDQQDIHSPAGYATGKGNAWRWRAGGRSAARPIRAA